MAQLKVSFIGRVLLLLGIIGVLASNNKVDGGVTGVPSIIIGLGGFIIIIIIIMGLVATNRFECSYCVLRTKVGIYPCMYCGENPEGGEMYTCTSCGGVSLKGYRICPYCGGRNH